MKAGAIAILAILFLSAALVPVSMAKNPGTSASAGNVYPSLFTAQIDHPAVAYTGQNITVYVNLSYGYENYNLTVYFAGENLTGFEPTDTFHQYAVNNSYFKFFLVMPNTPQTLSLLVVASATAGTGNNVSYTGKSQITVSAPLVLHAILKNPSSVPIRNAKLSFLIDGSVVSTKIVPLIPAKGTVNVNVSLVLTTPLSKGEHTVTVTVDSSVLLVNSAGSSYSSTFYYGTPPNFTWIYYVAIGVVLFMAFMVFASGRRRPTTGPKWKR